MSLNKAKISLNDNKNKTLKKAKINKMYFIKIFKSFLQKTLL